MERRKKPEGVIEKKGRWYYRPTSESARAARAKEGLPETVPLGRAWSAEASAKYLELNGERSALERGTVGELLDLWVRPDELGRPTPGAPIWTKDNGRPRSKGTVKHYAWAIRKVLRPRFGAMRYGATAIDAAAGRAIGTMHVQRLVADIGTTSANVYVGCLSSVFMWAWRNGRTTYNPCEGAALIAQDGRTREPLPWEVECLGAMAEWLGRKRMALMIDFEAIAGWRSVDLRGLVRKQLGAVGIHGASQKNGRRQLLVWNEDLRRIIREALELPGARRAGVFPLSHVFAGRSGKALSGSAFWDAFRLLVEQTNAELATCEIPLSIDDITFHDIRSKAGDDAAEQGQDRADFLGDTEAVANKHYARRERKVLPLKLNR
jgi:integrase